MADNSAPVAAVPMDTPASSPHNSPKKDKPVAKTEEKSSGSGGFKLGDIIKYPIRRSKKSSMICKGMICNLIRQTFFMFRTYLDMLIDFVFSLFWEDSRKAIPDLEKRHNMLKESALKLAAMIRYREIKSEDLVNACIERIQAVNPILNAITDERFEDALKEAREIDRMIENGLSDEYFEKKPLLGVPFTAKESIAVAGMLHTLGIAQRKYVRSSADAAAVRLLRGAGALPLALTNVPEINKWQETRNMLFGQTNNPYHTGRTVGGSSGGEAALAAAFASPISLCSDIGGSTRMPAFYCGVFAHNPSAGYTNLEGVALRTGEELSMASVGFLSKHSDDLAPLTKIILGNRAVELDFDRPVDIKNLNFYYVETSKDWRVSPIYPDLRKAMTNVVTKLTEGSSATDRAPRAYYHEGFNHMFSLWRYWMTREAESFPRMLTNNQGEARAIIELPKKLLGMSSYTLAAVFKLIDEQIMPSVNKEWAEELTKEMIEDLTMLLGDNGVLLFPSAPAVAPYHYSLYLRPYNFAYWALFNALKFPAAQVPLGLNKEGIPLGIQVVAAPRQDALCIAVAKYLEKEFGGFVPPCKIIE